MQKLFKGCKLINSTVASVTKLVLLLMMNGWNDINFYGHVSQKDDNERLCSMEHCLWLG